MMIGTKYEPFWMDPMFERTPTLYQVRIQLAHAMRHGTFVSLAVLLPSDMDRHRLGRAGPLELLCAM